VPALAEVQARFCHALIDGSGEQVLPFLQGGPSQVTRLAIHQRHYKASLVRALLEKFPGCAWLVGEKLFRDAAREFVRIAPPAAACIAEYGEAFPNFLASQPEVVRLPYLLPFAELEWYLGKVAIAIDLPAVSMCALSNLDHGPVEDMTLELQPGLKYYAATWPVDDLIQLFLSEKQPSHYPVKPTSFQMKRLDPSTFAFRATIADGNSVGVAAENALDIDPGFEAGRSLATVSLPRRSAQFDRAPSRDFPATLVSF